MQTSKAGIDLIKKWEGFSAKPYLCPAGVWTIGYGSTHGVTADTQPIGEEEGMARLRLEVRKWETAISRLVKVPLNQHQFDALVSFIHNLGAGAFQRSTLRAKLNRGEYETAAGQFDKWVFAGGRKLAGLIARRGAERALFLTPLQKRGKIGDEGEAPHVTASRWWDKIIGIGIGQRNAVG